MPKGKPISHIDATDMLVAQFSAPDDSFEQLAGKLGSVEEAACVMTTNLAGTFCADARVRGEVTRHLAEWHSTVKEDCSDLFRAHQYDNPTASREEVNSRTDMQILNGIRRGLHRAMLL